MAASVEVASRGLDVFCFMLTNSRTRTHIVCYLMELFRILFWSAIKSQAFQSYARELRNTARAVFQPDGSASCTHHAGLTLA